MSALTWVHAILMSLTVLLAIAAVVIVFRKKLGYTIIHKWVARSAVSAGVTGVIVMAVNKTINGYPHLKSQHSQGGLVAIILLLSAATAGQFMGKIGKKGKLVHKIIALAALVMALLAAAGGISQVR